VAATVVGDDRHERLAVQRAQHRAGGEVRVALLAQRVDGAVAVGVVVASKNSVSTAWLAVQVDDPQEFAARELADPALAGRDIQAQADIGCGLDAHLSTASLAAKPRPFSAQAHRTASASPAGSTESSSRRTGRGLHSATGSSGCGALHNTTSVSSSKRTVTLEPAGELPATNSSAPCSPTATFVKRLTFRDEIAAAEAMLGELDEQAVARAARQSFPASW